MFTGGWRLGFSGKSVPPVTVTARAARRPPLFNLKRWLPLYSPQRRRFGAFRRIPASITVPPQGLSTLSFLSLADSRKR